MIGCQVAHSISCVKMNKELPLSDSSANCWEFHGALHSAGNPQMGSGSMKQPFHMKLEISAVKQ